MQLDAPSLNLISVPPPDKGHSAIAQTTTPPQFLSFISRSFAEFASPSAFLISLSSSVFIRVHPWLLFFLPHIGSKLRLAPFPLFPPVQAPFPHPCFIRVSSVAR